MEIIKKHKKVFIIIVIIAALITGILVISMSAFINIGSSVISNVVGYDDEANLSGASSNAIPERIIQQDFKHDELDFTNGPVVFTLSDEFKDISSGGANFMSAYLEEGDKLEVVYKVKDKNGEVNFDLYGGTGLVWGTRTSSSGKDTVYIGKSGNYVFEYYADNFKGNFDIKVTVTRP